MKRIFTMVLATVVAVAAQAATLLPVQLLGAYWHFKTAQSRTASNP